MAKCSTISASCCRWYLPRRGIAFNVMAKAVDWERDDLFHVPTDDLIAFLVNQLSRQFVLRNDYGLYDYTTYVYREPDRGKSHPLWRQGLR
jgi:hypothetical protein